MSTPPEPGDGNMGWESGAGWLKFPNGVIMQCGQANVSSQGNDTPVPFNIPFAVGCFGFWATHIGTDAVAFCLRAAPTTTNVVVRAIAVYPDYVPPSYDWSQPNWGIYWFAIGL